MTDIAERAGMRESEVHRFPEGDASVPSAVARKTGFAAAYRNRGGILAEVLSGGAIAIGDALVAEALPS